ncbi:hypothetical protein VP01_1559g2 [Puccinia sorghi]|uniref:Uncharacterized protein n=1 Tax=Puccinia sorghi TaxID=27349 RepID=A0A0L6VIM7_9BASI|nr:hypothetical protein VP01_1559g2 [Puccinia sorghi]
MSHQCLVKESLEETHQLLNEANYFFKAAERLRDRAIHPRTTGSLNGKLAVSRNLQELVECYKHIIKHIRNHLYEASGAPSWKYLNTRRLEKPRQTGDLHFREAIRRELESRVETLAVRFVTDDTWDVDLDAVVSSENLLLRTINFFYRHQLITLESLRGFFRDPEALKKTAIRIMNLSLKFTRSLYLKFNVSPNFESMAEYWEGLYSVTILRALDKKSQTLVTYFALQDFVDEVRLYSMTRTGSDRSQRWIEIVGRFIRHDNLDRLAHWFEKARMGEGSQIPNQYPEADLGGLEDEVQEIMGFFHTPLQESDTNNKELLIFQHICNFNILDFIHKHYGSELFKKISNRVGNDRYNQLMSQITLMRFATRIKELVDNLAVYKELVFHGILKNQELARKGFPDWGQYFEKQITSSHQFLVLYQTYLKPHSSSINHLTSYMLETACKEVLDFQKNKKNKTEK